MEMKADAQRYMEKLPDTSAELEGPVGHGCAAFSFWGLCRAKDDVLTTRMQRLTTVHGPMGIERVSTSVHMPSPRRKSELAVTAAAL